MLNSKESKELQEIEDKLTIYLASDRKNWANTYLLMKTVRDKKLYERNYRSFTQWVNELADKNNYHQSTLWNRFNAGNVYEEYAHRQKEAGNTNIKPIQEVDISPDTVSLVGTIANRSKNKKYTDELMNKALNHEMSRQDLRRVNQQIRAEHSRGQKDVDTDLDQIKTAATIDVTAEMMVNAFKNNPNWLDPTHRHRKNDFYKVYPELPVHSGTSAHARRMDECILENLTDDHALSNHVNIHCIENKVSKSDLIRDKKMGEYAQYGDYFWLCIPKELIEVAKGYVAEGWGIITVNDKEEISIERKAQRRKCLFRQETLTEAVTHRLSI